jgi:HPt (histidine-containing phosphotransfer) domain-containing protein
VDAFEHFVNGRYGLVLTDLSMPRMDGFDLTRAIRRHEAENGAGRVPILALTANVMQGEPERCREAGMDDFAAKPTTIPFLAAKLQQWLGHLDWGQEPQPPVPSDGVEVQENGILDLAALAEVTGGDAELGAELVRDFLASTGDDLRELDEALAAGELEEARRRAHRIKGAARIVGAHEVCALAQQVEHAAAAGSSAEQLAPLVAPIRSALGACKLAAGSVR